MNPRLRFSQKWKNEGWWDPFDRSTYGVSFSGGERDHLFISSHAELFVDVFGLSGMDSPSDGRGFAILDIDRDGKPDIAAVSSNSPPLNLFHNEIPRAPETGNYIAVRFVGGNHQASPSKEWSNRDGAGAKVAVGIGNHVLTREQHLGEGFATQNSATTLIGIGAHPSADSIEVHWPTHRHQRRTEVPAGSLVTCYENPAESPDGSGFAVTPYQPAGGPAPLARGAAPGTAPPKDRFVLASAASAPSAANAPTTKLNVYITMATWCAACKKHLPRVKELREAFGDGSVAIFGVPVDSNDSPEMLQDYVDSFEPAYRLLDTITEDERHATWELLRKQFKSDALPMTIVTNAKGEVVLTTTSVPTVSLLRKLARAQ